MATIKEDYVSFETAKLLKEKGFSLTTACYEDWVCCMYDTNGNIKWGCYSSEWYYRITLHMAMKWLRLMHDIDITIIPLRSVKKYFPRIESDKIGYDGSLYIIYEEAAEVAIKYCLENLI